MARPSAGRRRWGGGRRSGGGDRGEVRRERRHLGFGREVAAFLIRAAMPPAPSGTGTASGASVACPCGSFQPGSLGEAQGPRCGRLRSGHCIAVAAEGKRRGVPASRGGGWEGGGASERRFEEGERGDASAAVGGRIGRGRGRLRGLRAGWHRLRLGTLLVGRQRSHTAGARGGEGHGDSDAEPLGVGGEGGRRPAPCLPRRASRRRPRSRPCPEGGCTGSSGR